MLSKASLAAPQVGNRKYGYFARSFVRKELNEVNTELSLHGDPDGPIGGPSRILRYHCSQESLLLRKGCRPYKASYSTMPRQKRSDLPSNGTLWFAPWFSCSGDAYPGVTGDDTEVVVREELFMS